MYQLIVFLPLFGFLIAGIFGKWIGDRGAEYVTCGLLGVCFVLSWIAFFQVAGGADAHVPVANWFTSGKLSVAWALKIDTLTAVMLVVVTTVSFVVHVYSIGYMAEDPSKPRFFAYLSLFTFAMLMLIGGLTGILLAVPPVDFVVHNTVFLVAETRCHLECLQGAGQIE
jgi:NADH-quinone oxidoreductase subunit L